MSPLDRDVDNTAAAMQPNLPDVIGVNVTASEAELDRTVACPACQVRAGQRCTAPTETGRREVTWTHAMRHDARMGWT